jgi:hypothetical protein
VRAKLDLRPPQPTPPAPPPYVSKRRHPRHQLPIRCWIADGVHTVYLRVHDVSAGGLSVRAPVAFEPQHVVEVRLELPGGRLARLSGRVVWVRHDAEVSGPRMGAEFVEVIDGGDDLFSLVGRP